MICKCGNETGATWKTMCRTCWRNQPPEAIRAHRQAKLDRRVARMRAKADRMYSEGDQKMSGLNAHHGDIAFFTQPNINSSGGRAFTNYRNRLNNRFDKGVRLQLEADEIRQRADWAERSGVQVKGDAERKRQAERDALDTVIHVGTRVIDLINAPAYALATVVKVNKKTYTLKFDHGSQYAVEKTFCRLAKEEQEGVTA